MTDKTLARIKAVLSVLTKHGLAGVLCRYGFAWGVPFLKRSTAPPPPDLPKRLRKAMEDLGGTYIKLGQLLSIRPDLIPHEYCEEFAKLLDHVPPEPLSSVERVIKEELDAKAFTHIDPRPLGSASIAQVHKARTKSGHAVAVKIRRPDIVEQFNADIRILRYIANKLHKHLQNAINPLLILDEFERYTKKELNFIVEATHIDTIRKESTLKNVTVPKVHWELTTEKVLTMQYLDGTKLSDTKKAQKTRVARAIVDAYIEQVFEIGTFHADLHPGNVLLLKNNNIGLLDFGIIGTVDSKTRHLGLDLYLAVLDQDSERIAQILLEYGTPSSNTNVPHFTRAVRNLLTDWWEAVPHQKRITHLLHQLFILCVKHHILIPQDAILLGKGMVTAEATARTLDPSFNFVTYTKPKITTLLKKRKTPQKLLARYANRTKAFTDAVGKLPGKTIDMLDALKQGRVDIHLDDTHFRHVGDDLNKSSNRLSYSLVAAALIVAGALMIDTGPTWGTYSIISLISLSIASILLLALLVSIAREHTPKYDPHE